MGIRHAEDQGAEEYYLEMEDRKSQRYYQLLSRHPDCRDPDHPGCAYCNPEEFGEGDGEKEEED